MIDPFSFHLIFTEGGLVILNLEKVGYKLEHELNDEVSQFTFCVAWSGLHCVRTYFSVAWLNAVLLVIGSQSPRVMGPLFYTHAEALWLTGSQWMSIRVMGHAIILLFWNSWLDDFVLCAYLQTYLAKYSLNRCRAYHKISMFSWLEVESYTPKYASISFSLPYLHIITQIHTNKLMRLGRKWTLFDNLTLGTPAKDYGHTHLIQLHMHEFFSWTSCWWHGEKGWCIVKIRIWW